MYVVLWGCKNKTGFKKSQHFNLTLKKITSRLKNRAPSSLHTQDKDVYHLNYITDAGCQSLCLSGTFFTRLFKNYTG
jgi:hypothetical protein